MRAPWVSPPCRAPAVTPASRSCSATRSAPRWVRTKINDRPGRAAISAVSRVLSLGAMLTTWWAMVVTLAWPELTWWVTGSFRYCFTSRSTAPSKVAENSSRCPPAGTASRISVTAGMKPRSAMWSASSSTTISIRPRSTAPCSIRSISRPGVATTMSTPRWNARSCGVYDMPPATRTTDRSTVRASGVSTSVTCIASSRVGTSTSPRGCEPAAPASVVIIGRPKARVLPEPVWPRPSTSRPVSASGIVAVWMGNGLVMSERRSCSTRLLGRPREAKSPSAGWSGAGSTGRLVSDVSAVSDTSDCQRDSRTGAKSSRAGRSRTGRLARGGLSVHGCRGPDDRSDRIADGHRAGRSSRTGRSPQVVWSSRAGRLFQVGLSPRAPRVARSVQVDLPPRSARSRSGRSGRNERSDRFGLSDQVDFSVRAGLSAADELVVAGTVVAVVVRE